jgi:hypothetical protein
MKNIIILFFLLLLGCSNENREPAPIEATLEWKKMGKYQDFYMEFRKSQFDSVLAVTKDAKIYWIVTDFEGKIHHDTVGVKYSHWFQIDKTKPNTVRTPLLHQYYFPHWLGAEGVAPLKLVRTN